MTPRHHPGAALLAAYGGGTLAEAPALAIAQHASSCAPCRVTIALAEEVGGVALETVTPAPMNAGALDRALRRLGAPDPTTPRGPFGGPLARYLPDGWDAAPWRWLGPGVQAARLAVGAADGPRTHLLRVAGGVRLPRHTHRRFELTLVLAGAYGDQLGHFGAGDLAELDGAVEHAPVAAPGVPCVCLVVTEARLVLRSPLARIAQAFGDL